MLSAEAIEAVKAATDLPDLAMEYGVKLQRAAGGYVARCCFHDEKTASLRIHTAGARKNNFKCFGCGASGGSIDFIMRIEGMPFPKAVEYLAERAGISLDKQHVGRQGVIANKEDTECAQWWWGRHFATARGLLDRAMLDPALAIDDEWADTLGRLLRAIDAMKPAEKLQQFLFNVRGSDRVEFRAEKEEKRRFAEAWLTLARS